MTDTAVRAEAPPDRSPSAPPLPAARRLPVSWPAALAAGLLVVSSLVAAAVAHTVVRDEEHRLLKERAAEAGLYVSSAFGSVQSQLVSLGTGSLLTSPPQTGFAKVAVNEGLLQSGESAALVSTMSSGGFAVVAAVGPLLHLGEVVTGARAVAAAAALHQPGLVSTTVLARTATTASIGLAVGPPGAPPGQVVYLELAIPSNAGQGTAFSELTAALYAVPRAEPSQLLLTANGRVPSGTTITQPVVIGSSKWLLVVGTRTPLVGSLAVATPWLLFAGLLLSALLVALALETVSRRRDYAVGLVDERTVELRASLAELRSTQAQLVHSERLAAVGELASTVGHELRNPLGVISNSLYLIRTATASTADDRLRRQLATADREIAAATVIVTDLLDFARARPPIIGGVDLAGLIDESLEVAPPPEGVEVSWHRPAAVPEVAGDRDQLRQVLLNLISNGYDALGPGGRLTITVARNAGGAVLTVADDGAGMDAETITHIFEPFFTTKARGTGLGLAVADRIIRDHGGTLAVASTVGVGTTFTISLAEARGEQ